MRTKVLLVVAALLMAIVSTVAIGSNMGFKISIPLSTTGDGSNFVSIPYYWSVGTWSGYTDPSPGSLTASDLYYDVGMTVCQEVQRYDAATSSLQIRSRNAFGIWTGTDFPIVAGEGYIVKVKTGANYICVGSHNPSLALTMTTAGDGSNVVSVPYHFTSGTWSGYTDPSPGSETASDLYYSVGMTVCQEVQRYDPSTSSLVIRSRNAFGIWTGTDFPVVPGTAYIVKVKSGTSWTPSHY